MDDHQHEKGLEADLGLRVAALTTYDFGQRALSPMAPPGSQGRLELDGSARSPRGVRTVAGRWSGGGQRVNRGCAPGDPWRVARAYAVARAAFTRCTVLTPTPRSRAVLMMPSPILRAAVMICSTSRPAELTVLGLRPRQPGHHAFADHYRSNSAKMPSIWSRALPASTTLTLQAR
jgi:hypothetical protein